MTGQDLVSRSMRIIGALASGETPTAAEASDGLQCVNGMINSWKAERLMAFTIEIQEFPLVGGQQIYTYGIGGNFNTVRPVKIERVSIVSLTNPSQPLELPIDYFCDYDWQRVPVKVGIQTTLPQGVYDDGNYPLRNISVLFTPSVVSNLRFYVWQQLNQFPDLFTDVQFPEGYEEAFVYNLAVRLIVEMPGEYSQVSVAQAQNLATESLARVKSINLPVIRAQIDPALCGQGGHYNYYSDTVTGGWSR